MILLLLHIKVMKVIRSIKKMYFLLIILADKNGNEWKGYIVNSMMIIVIQEQLAFVHTIINCIALPATDWLGSLPKTVTSLLAVSTSSLGGSDKKELLCTCEHVQYQIILCCWTSSSSISQHHYTPFKWKWLFPQTFSFNQWAVANFVVERQSLEDDDDFLCYSFQILST